jgi:hypothetical protein
VIEMQMNQVSLNSTVTGNQPQTNTVNKINTDNTENTDKTQTSETNQASNTSLSTDRVTISPEAQRLAQQSFEPDGSEPVEDTAVPNAPGPYGQVTNGSSSEIPRGATGINIFG